MAYAIFCDEQVLNSLHFLTGTSAGFLRTALAGLGRQKAPPDACSSSSPMKARDPAAIPRKRVTGLGPVHRNGVRPVQGLLEGLMTTGGRQVLATCPIVFCHLQLAARRSATEPPHREVTSPQAMAPCAACAPAGRLPCRPPASAGSWAWERAPWRLLVLSSPRSL